MAGSSRCGLEIRTATRGGHMTHPSLRFGFVMIVAVAVCLIAVPLWAQVATPRTSEGHPDLSGLWNGAVTGINRVSEDGGNLTSNVASRRCAPNQKGCNDQTNQTVDGEFTGRMDSNRPLYKRSEERRVGKECISRLGRYP